MDVFPSKTPHGLPPVRDIEHKIGFVLRATLANRVAYMTNPKETMEI